MYDLNKLRMYFDMGSYSRGERYFRQGRVSALRVHALDAAGLSEVTALVRGSESRPYQVQAILDPLDLSPLTAYR